MNSQQQYFTNSMNISSIDEKIMGANSDIMKDSYNDFEIINEFLTKDKNTFIENNDSSLSDEYMFDYFSGYSSDSDLDYLSIEEYENFEGYEGPDIFGNFEEMLEVDLNNGSGENGGEIIHKMEDLCFNVTPMECFDESGKNTSVSFDGLRKSVRNIETGKIYFLDDDNSPLIRSQKKTSGSFKRSEFNHSDKLCHLSLKRNYLDESNTTDELQCFSRKQLDLYNQLPKSIKSTIKKYISYCRMEKYQDYQVNDERGIKFINSNLPFNNQDEVDIYFVSLVTLNEIICDRSVGPYIKLEKLIKYYESVTDLRLNTKL